MPSPPTRRSRPTNEDRSLPIVPILIGVIVLGFVIGAGLSLSGRHDTAVVALASSSPTHRETFVPVTPAPTEKPTPQRTSAPAASERPTPGTTSEPATTAEPSPPATARPSSMPATARPLEAAPRALAGSKRLAAVPATSPRAAKEDEPTVSSAPRETSATPVPTDAPDTTAAPVPRDRATAAAQMTEPASVATAPGETAFARLSAAVVRQFLESVKRGDQTGAFAVLASPPASWQGLPEYGVVDARTNVGRIDAHGAANDDAFVSVAMDSPSGPYFGQYTVHKNDTGAAVIVAHSIVKP